jgi:hypothetical protein
LAENETGSEATGEDFSLKEVVFTYDPNAFVVVGSLNL